MNLTGKSYIAGEWRLADNATSFRAYAPALNTPLPQPFYNASTAMVNEAARAADAAFFDFAELPRIKRAVFLETIAEEIENLGHDLIKTTQEETGLPEARLLGERGRTVKQLRLFAHHLRNGSDKSISEAADPNRQPLAKPATKLTYLSLGPVAVFGASNFPYAFSTAGGDTASALAAGCPVIVKGHPAHPGTAELTAQAIDKAIRRCDLPNGVFSLLQSNDHALSHALVMQPEVQAVGFTGSESAAMALINSMDKRQQRIPFYGELGSVNPQIVLPNVAQNQAQELAATLVASMVLGGGQFCTNPGVWFVPEHAESFIDSAAVAISSELSCPLLTPQISQSYQLATASRLELSTVTCLGQGQKTASFHVTPMLFKTSASAYLSDRQLHQEVFGPTALIVTYDSPETLMALLSSLNGQLTASVLGDEQDIMKHDHLIKRLKYKVGRLIYNQMPTGVEVCYAMNHGGPFPASTDVRSTSVGIEAMARFLRPLCVQE